MGHGQWGGFIHRGVLSVGCLVLAAIAGAEPPRTLEEVTAALQQAARQPWIELSEIGRSAGNQPIWALRLGSAADPAAWRVMAIGRQHGDEPAGTEALLELIERAAADPGYIPADTVVWTVPVVNPDGTVANARANAAGADLNRDHILLEQPETRAVHGLARTADPHVVVDCHEFTRDSADFHDQGWGEWPVVTMDTSNHPLLPTELYELGLRWVNSARGPLEKAGFPYRRYLVGGVPPQEELRPSTLDADDARNGLSLEGRLGFIIESGIYRSAEDPHEDLPRRAAAQLALIERFLSEPGWRELSLQAVAAARAADPPEYFPTNVLWGRGFGNTPQLEAVRLTDGSVQRLPAPLMMDQRVIKGMASTPNSYFITAAAAATYRELLERHGLSFVALPRAATYRMESCRLLRLEEDFDPVYQRYGGRQVVTCDRAERREMPEGSLLVPVNGPSWRRACTLLEAQQLYGLYQYERFRSDLPDSGELPVYRVPRTR